MRQIIDGELKLINRFIEGLSQAIGASSQMIHQHQDPRWMTLRDLLTAVKETTVAVAVNPITRSIRT